MVEPAATVDDVHSCNHEDRADDGGVGEAEDLPSILVRVLLDGLHEPIQLFLIDGNLVRSAMSRRGTA